MTIPAPFSCFFPFFCFCFVHTIREVNAMSKKKRKLPEDLRLNPAKRLTPRFDQKSIAEYPLPEPEEMGFRVVDNCAEEHMM